MSGKASQPLQTLPSVAGRRGDDGWKVWIAADGMTFELDAARARQLAQDIADMCDVIDGAHAAVEPDCKPDIAAMFPAPAATVRSHESGLTRGIVSAAVSCLPPRHRDGGKDDQEPVPC